MLSYFFASCFPFLFEGAQGAASVILDRVPGWGTAYGAVIRHLVPFVFIFAVSHLVLTVAYALFLKACGKGGFGGDGVGSCGRTRSSRRGRSR